MTWWTGWSALAFPVAAPLVGAIAATAWILLSRRKPQHPFPPGPKPLPVIGNLFDIPRSSGWKVYKDWSEKHGSDIIYLNALGTRIIVLNSLKTVNALLNLRAPNFSDRGFSPVIELTRGGWQFSAMNYSQSWREHRRLFHQFFNISKVHKHHSVIEQEIRRLMHNLLLDPKNFHMLSRRAFGAIIARIAYGIKDPAYNERLVEEVDVLVAGIVEYLMPGRLLVNTFPVLQVVPAWFPGAGWKRRLNELADISDNIVMRPWEDAKDRAMEGAQAEYDSMAPQFIQQLSQDVGNGKSTLTEDMGRNTCAMLYLAGADTTVSSTIALFLALAMHPEVQRRAQAELDDIIGPCRLPRIKDIEHLPYIQAICKETSRWHSVAPLGVPHVSTEDEVYNGYLIPAKTIVFPNTWAIMHDPAVFEDPMSFKPERYLTADGTRIDPTVLGPEAAAFGYGRRICPGRHMSNDALSLLLASLLACFDINPAKDAEGRPIPLELKVDSASLVVTPEAFACEIVARSEEHAEMIRSLGDTL